MTAHDIGPESLDTLKSRFCLHQGTKSRRLYLAFYDLLASGQLHEGARLPASRQLAPLLELGRNTVTSTYQQLVDEGLLYTAQRGGTRVRAAVPAARSCLVSTSTRATTLSQRAATGELVSRPAVLRPGEPDSTMFPRTAWSRALSLAARRAAAELGYRNDAGEACLREAIARYLGRWRSLLVDPECILITASTRQSLAIAGSLYADAGDLAWVESPGYAGARDAWNVLGLQLRPLDIDLDGAVFPDDLESARLLYTTPCFQYPSGHSLAPARRSRLLAGARASGTVVFEDDYDSEFREDSQPRPALASEAQHSAVTVLHAGTFSKLMFPAVRLAWLVLPRAHVAAGVGVLRTLGGGHNPVQQGAVAELLDNGTVAKHLVRARSEYGRRRRALIEALSAGSMKLRHGSGGLSLVVDLPEPVPRLALANALHACGVGAQPLEELILRQVPSELCRALVIGTGNVDVPGAERAVAALYTAWREAQSARA